MISALDLFKIGIGPSSSHTVGPMIAARRFVDELRADALATKTARLTIELFGSLAWTGMGHGTDTAILLGLCGYQPATVDPDRVPAILALIRQSEKISIDREPIEFIVTRDLHLNRRELLPHHSNAMRFVGHDGDGNVLASRIYYSVGGGFVVAEDDGPKTASSGSDPLPFRSADELFGPLRNKPSIDRRAAVDQ